MIVWASIARALVVRPRCTQYLAMVQGVSAYEMGLFLRGLRGKKIITKTPNNLWSLR